MNQSSSVRPLEIGNVLNEQYTIHKVLGIGGFGITYLCQDDFLNKSVAIKEFFPTQIANRDITNGTNIITASSSEYEKLYKKGLKDYEYEANKLTKFTGLDGVVSVLNFFFENGTAYMVMEYIEGITLKKYLNDHGEKVSWQEMLSLMRPIFRSMKLIHDEGIIHRDISPDNIMISKEKKLTIIDFGSAKNYTDGEDTAIMLKHGYAPPEQYSRKGNHGPWTDVYALCATMYRMVVGKRPPKSIDIKSGAIKMPSMREIDNTIPGRVEKAIKNGLCSEINERTQSVGVLEKQLYALTAKKRTAMVVLGVVMGLAACITGICIFNNKSVNTSGTQQVETNLILVENKDEQEEKKETSEQVIPEKYTIPSSYLELSEIETNDLSYDIQDDSVIINKISASVVKGRIPETIEGMPVKKIAGAGQNITDIMIPEGVEIIADEAFKNCVYLERLFIPSTINEIGKNAFVNCRSISEVELSADNEEFYIEENALYRKNGEEVVKW